MPAKKKEIVLSEEHRALADLIGFEPSVIAAVVDTNFPDLRQLTVERVGDDHRLHNVSVEGFCFDSGRMRAELVMTDLRKKFEKKGYLFFLSDIDAEGTPVTVAVIKGTDQFDILPFVETQDANGDQTTDDILAILRSWHTQYPFRITGAGRDWVEAKFQKNPSDMLVFVEEMLKVAPDVYSQGGFDSLDELADAMRRAKSFQLWWD